jgi:4a-hydroxytetrahydrobiopterin dehydratase
MMAKLALRHCTPIKKGTKPISASIAYSLIKQLHPGWSFSRDTKGLEQEFRFKDFQETIGFVNAVAWIANTQDHHPDMEVGYNRCKVTFTTHAAGGLTVNDFICAAKIEALYKSTPEATVEKTQAIFEPRPKTGTVPRPDIELRPRTGTVPRPEMKNPELDISEAEELLNTELKAPMPEPAAAHPEDEIKLVDPDDEPTLPHLQNPPKFSTLPIAETVVMDNNPEAVAKEEEAPANQDGQNETNLFATVILPPGMQRIHDKGNDKGKDQDEEATVIGQPDFNHENIELAPPPDNDEVKTMIMPGLESLDDDMEENADMMKTMIIKPPLIDEDEYLNSGIDDDETISVKPKSPDKNRRK